MDIFVRGVGVGLTDIKKNFIKKSKTLQDLNGTIEELEKIRRELDEMTKTMLSMEEDRDMWKKLFEN